jgi:hypothetical protein
VQARVRGCRFKATWLILSLGALAALGQGQKSECARCEARGRRKLVALIRQVDPVGDETSYLLCLPIRRGHLVLGFFISIFKKKPPTAMDAFIRRVYGANPPQKSADLERSVTIAHEDLLSERVPLAEVKRVAGQLFQGPIPYSTHDLAISTALAFFKAPEFVPALAESQIGARLRVVNWAKDGKVVGPLAQSFEAALYKLYKPGQQEASQRSVANKETERKVQDAPTVKDLLIAREPPWNRVPPTVIKAIIAAITDKGLLEAFVMHSMDAGLVKRYEALDGQADPIVIRAQISQILCETGNRAIPTLAKAWAAEQIEAATKAFTLAGDTFEAAIILAKHQIPAYTGLATIFRLIGKEAEPHKHATLGLSELKKLRQHPASDVFRDLGIFPTDVLDQMERQLRDLSN